MKHPQQIATLVFLLCGLVFVWRLGRIVFFILRAKKEQGEGFCWVNLRLFFAKKLKQSTTTFSQKVVAAVFHSVLMAALVMMLVSVIFPDIETIRSATFWVSWGAIAASMIFIVRRAIVKVKRLTSSDLTTANKADAYTILILEIISSGTYIWSFYSGEWASAVHIMVMGGFLVYLTYSKHLHIFLALPYMVYSSAMNSSLSPIAMISSEFTGRTVQDQKLGSDRAEDMSRGDILGAFSCTQCGRCLQVCPSALAGGDISPRKVIIELRNACQSTDSTLYPTLITNSELYSCVSCGACAQACPIGIDPLRVIVKMRRFAALEEGSLPTEYSLAAANTIATQNPWALTTKQEDYE